MVDEGKVVVKEIKRRWWLITYPSGVTTVEWYSDREADAVRRAVGGEVGGREGGGSVRPVVVTEENGMAVKGRW